MTPTCVNLKDTFGSQFRIIYDPVSGPKPSKDPWMMMIPCKYGEIYPHGGTRLTFECRSGKIIGQLRRHPKFTIKQDGDGEASFLFEADDLPLLEDELQPKKRRVVSEAQRERLAEMGARTRFQNTA